MRRSAPGAVTGLAYHEASHGVTAEALAPGSLVRIDFTLVRNGQKGLVTWREAHNERTNALIAIAGKIGQEVWLEKTSGRRRQGRNGTHTSSTLPAPRESGGDIVAVNSYLRASGAHTALERYKGRRKLAREARRHVEKHWPEIDRLARALLARKAPFTMRRREALRAMRGPASYRSERRGGIEHAMRGGELQA